jgi:hypothetical protein
MFHLSPRRVGGVINQPAIGIQCVSRRGKISALAERPQAASIAPLYRAKARYVAQIRLTTRTIAQDDRGCPAARQFPARLNSIAWMARADGQGGVLRVFPRQRATGCFVACRPMPDKKRVPRPCPNWSSSVPSGTRTAWGGRGLWQGRGGCDGTSRNCPQTTALPICPHRDSGPVPRSRRGECRSAQPSRQGQANPAAAFAAP